MVRATKTTTTPAPAKKTSTKKVAAAPAAPKVAEFLGKTIGTEMARTEVSKEINAYIRANNLQRPDNGRFIVPDDKLTSLLKVGVDDELSYFNLQRYMKPHFIKAEATV